NEQCEGARCFRRDAFERRNLRDACAHRLHNLPSSTHRTKCDCRITSKWHPPYHMIEAVICGIMCNQRSHDDTHHLLCVIASMSDAEDCRRNKLQSLEP